MESLITATQEHRRATPRGSRRRGRNAARQARRASYATLDPDAQTISPAKRCFDGAIVVDDMHGLHWMLNVVTGAENEGAAVLIRGVDELNGPGRVAASLGINASFYGKEPRPETGLCFENATMPTHKLQIVATPRIGVAYAGPIWAPKKLRFVLA